MRTTGTIKTTDTMQQIQTVLTQGGLITFAPGIYRITKQLMLAKGTTLELNGATLRRCGNLQSIFINRVTSNTTAYHGAGTITIRNGTLEGMGGFRYDNTVTFFHSHDILLEHVTFLDCCGSHSIELNACRDVIIRNCRFLGYNTNPAATFREQIQIDFAGYSELVLPGTKPTSSCYDGTHCKDITIEACCFEPSANRPGCNAAIGNHAACSNGDHHTKIQIRRNRIQGYGSDPNQCGINLTAADGVVLEENQIKGFGRAVRIFAPAYFYAPNGAKKTTGIASGAGSCRSVVIRGNEFGVPTGILKSSGIYSYSKAQAIHEDIEITENHFLAGTASRDAVNLTAVRNAKIYENDSDGRLQYRGNGRFQKNR